MWRGWATAVVIALLGIGCPAPERVSNSYPYISDAVSDIRALLPGFGGHDPHTGVPVFGDEARRIHDVLHGRGDREELRTYDEAGRITYRVTRDVGGDPEIERWYTWDAEGGPETLVSSYLGQPPGPPVQMRAESGRLVEAGQEDTENLWTYQYDEAGRVTQMIFVLDSVDSEGFTIEYSYDPEGRLVSKQLWRSWGLWIDVLYEYDGAGRLSRKIFVAADRDETDIVEQYTWEGDQLVGVARPKEGWSEALTYDDAGRLAQMTRTYIPKVEGTPRPAQAFTSRVRTFEY